MANNTLHKIRGFYNQLKKRKVFRVAAVYIVVGWVIIQAASIIFPALQLPDWTITFVVALTLLGFPIAVIVAWAFQMTPDGLERSGDDSAHVEASNKTGSGRSIIIPGLIGLLIAAWAGWWYVNSDAQSTNGNLFQNSIAVLPFDNFSANKKNSYFTAGIHEAILTQLAKVEDLQVISRTSVMPYEETEKSVTEIAKELNVANIVEGSVQRVEDRVRITVQLIDAETDEHLWAKHYDRALTAENIFDIQSIVAKKIVGVLQAKLTPKEQNRIESNPTDNLTAYNLYLRALKYDNRGISEKNVRKAIMLYKEAINIDPDFALAYSRLSVLHSRMYWFSFDSSNERIEQAKTTAEKALQLAPHLPRAYIAMGYYFYHGQRNYKQALAQFKKALNGLPNNSDVLAAMAYIHRRLGNRMKAVAMLEKAIDIDPYSLNKLFSLAQTYAAIKNYNEALRYINKALNLEPKFHAAYIIKGLLYSAWKGKNDSLKAALGKVPEKYDFGNQIAWLRFDLKMINQKYEKALKLIKTLPEEGVRTQLVFLPKDLLLGIAYRAKGNFTKATAHLHSARVLVKEAIEEKPEEPALHSTLGYIYALLRNKKDAVREGRRATTLLPVTKDAVDGSAFMLDLAAIYAHVGEEQKALDLLEGLKVIPLGSQADFEISHRWKPLRDNPRFHKIKN